MRRIVCILVATCLLSGCLSKDQRAQITRFWSIQFEAIVSKILGKKTTQVVPLSELQGQIEENNKNATVATTSVASHKSSKKTKAVSYEEPISAKLFLSDSCGWCRKLKQSGFPGKFRNKYIDEVDLKIYEVHSADGRREFARAIQKHHLSGGVPLLIIGNSVIHGYSDEMMALADEKVRIELKKLGREPGKPKQEGPAVVSITMEDDEITGPASTADKARMQVYLDQIRDNNEETLKSLNSMFKKSVWNQAVGIISTSENQLKQIANKSATYADFAKKAAVLEKEQQKQIDQLLRDNIQKTR